MICNNLSLKQDETWWVLCVPPRCWCKHHLSSLNLSWCVNSSLLITLTLLPLIIFTRLSVRVTTWSITLSQDLQSEDQDTSGSSGEQSHSRGLSEVSQISRNKLFPGLCQFPRVYHKISRAMQIWLETAREYHRYCIHWRLKWTDLTDSTWWEVFFSCSL